MSFYNSKFLIVVFYNKMNTTKFTVVNNNCKKRLVEDVVDDDDDDAVFVGTSLFSHVAVVFVTIEFVLANGEKMNATHRRFFFDIFVDSFLCNDGLVRWQEAVPGTTSSFVFVSDTVQVQHTIRENAIARCTSALQAASFQMSAAPGRVMADVNVIDHLPEAIARDEGSTTTIVI